MPDKVFRTMERPWHAQYEAGIPPALAYPDVPLHRFLTDAAGRFPEIGRAHV